MADIIRFPGHHLYRCPSSCEGCYICLGGLASCTTCGGGEGSLPTDCPSERMHPDTEAAVYNEQLDYTRQLGWHEKKHSSEGGSAS